MQLRGIPRDHPGHSYRIEETKGIAVQGIAKSSKNNVPFPTPVDLSEENGNVSSWI